MNSVYELHDQFEKLRELFMKKDMNHGHHVSLILQKKVN